MTAQLEIEDVLDADGLADLETRGYAVGRLQIGFLWLHVVFIEVRYDEDDEEELLAVPQMSGVDSDFNAILDLMGDGAGHPMLLDYNGKEYLVGAMPYGR